MTPKGNVVLVDGIAQVHKPSLYDVTTEKRYMPHHAA
jgi:hypothetical protein